MYESYWGLSEPPFRNTVDPRRYYPSRLHDEALARILFLIEQRRRFGLVYGPAGTGKSLLLAVTRRQLRRTQRQSAYVDLMGLDGDELLWQLAAALNLGVVDGDSATQRWRQVHDQLRGLALSGSQVVMLFDHLERARPGCARTLERLLALGDKPDAGITVIAASRSLLPAVCPSTLVQLSDLRIELSGFDRQETASYVNELLRHAGCGHEVFQADALDTLFQRTGGVPRDINRLCDVALLAAMAEESHTVGRSILEAAADALGGCGHAPPEGQRTIGRRGDGATPGVGDEQLSSSGVDADDAAVATRFE